ncbi:hypothetical protein AYI69_g8942 [Smittium culicis]|uniref:Uncharacterized protein n=1 Tax=Smittium culicis TaxID=133412 RepID=A0A1R1XG38_9FUNG|nr:hypothetical protein AYI69_g8942 [Smittium culicis]
MLFLKLRGSSTLSKISSSCLKSYAVSPSLKLFIPSSRASFLNDLSRHFTKSAIISSPAAPSSHSSTLKPKSAAKKPSRKSINAILTAKKPSKSSLAAKKRAAAKLEKKRKELIAARVLKRSISLKRARDKRQALKDKLTARLNSTKRFVNPPSTNLVSTFNAYVGEKIIEFNKHPESTFRTSRSSTLAKICNSWANVDPQDKKVPIPALPLFLLLF